MQIDARILKARSALIMTQPFFGALAMRLIVAERKDIKTMATDGTFLYYCRAFLDWVSDADLIFTIAHEVLHCALSHMTRRGNRRWDLWQAATDHVVNLMLQEAGFKVPEWVKYCDPRFKGLGVEEVYAILENEEPKEPQKDDQQNQNEQDDKDDQNQQQGSQQGDGDDEEDDAETSQDSQEDGDDEGQDDQDDTGDGDSGDSPDSGSEEDSGDGDGDSQDGDGDASDGGNETGEGGEPTEGGQGGKGTGQVKQNPSYGDNDGGCGEVLDAAPPHDKDKLDDVASEWQVYTRQAANIARRAGEGRAPGFIEEVVEELNSPQTDWRDTLRRFVDPITSTKDYSWSKLNVRQYTMGYFTPGTISDGINHVVLIIDSSYSIDYEWLRKFGGESQAALDDGAVDKITLIFADTEVKRVAEYQKGEVIDFTVPGRGGTRFAPSFEWIKENLTDVSAAVYFTDLDCTDFGEEPYFPVLWAAYDSNPIVLKQRMANVPFGEIVELRQ